MQFSERSLNEHDQRRVWEALDGFRIEIPSWGFSNTGTRFGKFYQPTAASRIEQKFADAAQVHAVTGIVSAMALHVDWDLPNGCGDIPKIQQMERETGIAAGSINPNLFENQNYKYGSICNPSNEIRTRAITHLLDSVAIGQALKTRDVSLWVADGSNYPGTQSIRRRVGYMEEALSAMHAALGPEQRMLIEYKPFEPAFYHTDIADWGMALELARHAGPKAGVLVDTGHHLQGTNIEQIVTWLLHLKALGGFHFNDRRYADDDLTLGSIDPYQIFRIFHEILSAPVGDTGNIAYMIDQSHNLKGKIEATIQTICTAQELYAKAALVDRERLIELQDACRLVDAEEIFRDAFWKDVRPCIESWREARGLPTHPLQEFARCGYAEAITKERASQNAGVSSSYA